MEVKTNGNGRLGSNNISNFIYDNNYDNIGTIDVYPSNVYNFSFSLHIDYTDEINSSKHNETLMNDL